MSAHPELVEGCELWVHMLWDKMAKKIKLKTHRGAAKRFKRTKNGKFLRGAAFKQHILTSKTRKRKRRLKGTTLVADVDAVKLARMLPYK
jgi:large subunit ribosomal protein L35